MGSGLRLADPAAWREYWNGGFLRIKNKYNCIDFLVIAAYFLE